MGASVDATTTHKVWLPRNGRREDPNVQSGDVISYQREAGGEYVCPSGMLDGKINETVRILATVNVPAGWSIVNKGRFLVGWDDAPGACEYGTVGALGGFNYHGISGNNHDHHPNHQHTIPACGYDAQAQSGSGAGPFAWNVEPNTGQAGFAYHTDSDNRPPYVVVVWIMRTS